MERWERFTGLVREREGDRRAHDDAVRDDIVQRPVRGPYGRGVAEVAQLQVARWHWRCGVENSCQRERQIGKAQIRTFTLETKQLLTVGPVVQRGNSSYEIKVTSAGFAVGDVRYGPAKTRQTYLMLYG